MKKKKTETEIPEGLIWLTMTEFQGMVGRSWLNKSVKPNSSTTQLSLSQSMIVLSKSKITTIPAISPNENQTNKKQDWKNSRSSLDVFLE